MSGFFIDDVPREDTIPFGGVMVKARVDTSGRFEIQFPSQVQCLLAIKAHVDQVRHIGINETPPPLPAVETRTPAPAAHIAGPPVASMAPPVVSEPVDAVPVKRGRGRPRKAVPVA